LQTQQLFHKPNRNKDSAMTPQESQMLQEFLTQLTQAKGIAKDSEADALIRAAMSQQPDAGYLLVHAHYCRAKR
jgi:hypothetical protein